VNLRPTEVSLLTEVFRTASGCMLKHARPDLLASRPPAAQKSQKLMVAVCLQLETGGWLLVARTPLAPAGTQLTPC
jgi:hypothetical protein